MNKNNLLYRLENVRHYYGEKKALDIPSFKITRGNIVGLLGPNGSGKTTLLKLLAFVVRPSEGEIRYGGQVEYPFSKRIRSKVTLLTQKPYLLKRTVFENIAYGLRVRKDTSKLSERITEVLSLVGLDFDAFAHRMWHELSGGEAQRVALAARLILKPEALLLDEPVASVDVGSAQMIRKAAMKARDQWDTTLVIASHDLSWLFSVSDQQVSLLNGKLHPTGQNALIPGPFVQSDKGNVKRYISKNQIIHLKAPGNGCTTALIPIEKIKINDKPDTAKEIINQMQGTIESLHLEKKQKKIMVSISIDDFKIDLGLSFEQIQNRKWIPGKKVVLSFEPDAAQWL